MIELQMIISVCLYLSMILMSVCLLFMGIILHRIGSIRKEQIKQERMKYNETHQNDSNP